MGVAQEQQKSYALGLLSSAWETIFRRALSAR